MKNLGQPDTPKTVMQLAWNYEQQFMGDIQFQVNGKSVQTFYFHEVVADLGGGKVEEGCDPYIYGNCATATLANGNASSFRKFNPSAQEITNEHIIGLMQSGTVPMIAYGRYDPVLSLNAWHTGLIVTFKKSSQHKVVFSGFQPGEYPLLINDVGNGQRYRVRLSSNLNELKFYSAENPSTKLPLMFDPAFTGRPFLIYEGEDKKTNPQVFFIEHYDGLKIRCPKAYIPAQ